MLALLRSVVPQVVFDFTHKSGRVYNPYYINELIEADSAIIAYNAIIAECNRALSIHMYVKHLLDAKQVDSEGDCWNIATICAEYVYQKMGMNAVLFSTTDGSRLYHLEIGMELDNGLYKFMYVEPFNNLPRNHFEFSFSPAMSFDLYKFTRHIYYKLVGHYDMSALKFSNHGVVIGGDGVRKLIPQIYPKYIMPVVLLNLVSIQTFIAAGRCMTVFDDISELDLPCGKLES